MRSTMWPGRSEKMRSGRSGQGLVGCSEEFGVFLEQGCKVGNGGI